MNRPEFKQWTIQQFLEYYFYKDPNLEEISLWTCEQLILFIFERLQQPAGVVEMYSQEILREENYGFSSDIQKERFFRLSQETQDIPIVIHILLMWLVSHKVIDIERPEEVFMRADEQQFVTYFHEHGISLQNMLSWSNERFVQYVYHELLQKTTAALYILEYVFHEADGDGFTSPQQQEMLMYFREKLEIIQRATGILHIWLTRVR